MVGRHARLLGVVPQRVWPASDLRLVRDRVVEHSEERLRRLAIPVVRIFRRLIPNLPCRREVVIFFHVVRTVIPSLPQVSGKHLKARGQLGHGSHVLASGRRRIEPRDDRRARRRADGSVGPGTVIAERIASHRIDVGRDGIPVAIAPQLWAGIFARQPEDVRPLTAIGCATRHHPAQGQNVSPSDHPS